MKIKKTAKKAVKKAKKVVKKVVKKSAKKNTKKAVKKSPKNKKKALVHASNDQSFWVTDGSILSLIEMFLKSGVMVGSSWEQSEIGSPQGGVISPLLSNIYLDEFDQEMKRRHH